MHPQLITSLATEHHHDMQARLNAYHPMPERAARRHRRHLTVPKLRVTWSRTTLAAAGRRRGRSYVIVISATRTQ